MKKVVIAKAGGYDQLKILELPSQPLKQGEVRVAIKSIGVNYADCLVRWGVYESAKKLVGWPITPGFEFAGTITEVHPSVSDRTVGQSVFGYTLFNAYATEITVSKNQVFPKPEKFSFDEMAGFPTVFFAAYHGLFQIVRIYPGSTVLIHSAAGGAGSALIQLAKLKDLRVIGVVGNSSKVSYAKSLGADEVIDKSSTDLWSEVKRLAPQGVDAIFDANGYTTYKKGYEHLKETGKLICYGSHSLLPRQSGKISIPKAIYGLLKTPRFNPMDMINDNKTVSAFNVSFLFSRIDLAKEGTTDLLTWLEQGKIKPIKTTSFSLADVAKAHQFIESGLSEGKIILNP